MSGSREDCPVGVVSAVGSARPVSPEGPEPDVLSELRRRNPPRPRWFRRGTDPARCSARAWARRPMAGMTRGAGDVVGAEVRRVPGLSTTHTYIRMLLPPSLTECFAPPSLAKCVTHLDRPVQPFETLPELLRSRERLARRVGCHPTRRPRPMTTARTSPIARTSR